MTHTTASKVRLNGHEERERFEKWLLTPARARMPRDGSQEQQRLIRRNLERAHKAPFPLRTRLAIMEKIFSTADPAKALSILKGLSTITAYTGSAQAKKEYERLSSQWADDSMISGNKRWADRGFEFIFDKATEVPSRFNVAFPPKAAGQ